MKKISENCTAGERRDTERHPEGSQNRVSRPTRIA